MRIPATGFGLGFDRTLEAALELGLVPETTAVAQVLVTVFDSSLLSESIKIAKELRDEGITADMYPNGTDKLGKQMKYANDKQIPYVLILGPDEVKKGVVSLKNMETGEEKTGKLADLLI